MPRVKPDVGNVKAQHCDQKAKKLLNNKLKLKKMDPFFYYDITFLIICCIAIGLFFYKNRKKINVEAKIVLLYKTKVGLRLINWLSKKTKKSLPTIAYIIIAFGFASMITIVLLLIQSLVVLFKMPEMMDAPPLLPLLPYIPQAFDLGLPKLYFVYWIIAIGIIAITHECAHGIFMRHYKLKIKSTGFGFLGPFLLFFVEPSEKALAKKKPKQQMAILGAGSFSNFIFGIIFLLLMQLFFVAAYTPMGVGSYLMTYEILNLTDIENIGSYSTDDFFNLTDEEYNNILETNENLEVNSNNKTYFITPNLLEEIVEKKEKLKQAGFIGAFIDGPAFRANLSGGIQKINDEEVKNPEDILEKIGQFEPNETIKIETSEKEYEIVLDQHPINNSKGYLGIGFPQLTKTQEILGSMISPFFSFFTHAEPKFNKDTLNFITDFFLWLIIICFLVALFNMLPLAILDGGKFIYAAVFALTKSKKKAESVFKISSFLILLIVFVMMLVWYVRRFIIT